MPKRKKAEHPEIRIKKPDEALYKYVEEQAAKHHHSIPVHAELMLQYMMDKKINPLSI